MATPKELRAELNEARAAIQEALHHAHRSWDTAPPGEGGETAWSPRQVMEHFLGAEWFFTNAIAQACGAPALERWQFDVSTPGTTAASAARVAFNSDNILRHVSEADLAKTIALPIGEQSVEGLLVIMTSHARDHAAQIRAASV